MKRISLTEISHGMVRERLQSGDIAIDATLGNGHDCLFLAACVGETGHIYGFDIQRQAIESSRQRLQQQQLDSRTTLIQANHADMREFIPAKFQGQIAVIMFNLGYLPGTDKTVMTQTHSTLQAITVACDLLAGRGVITVMAYPGHKGGDEETLKLQSWLQELDSAKFSVDTVFSQNHQEHAPRLFVLQKLA
jgi:methylase of polypeptide subunit release factors